MNTPAQPADVVWEQRWHPLREEWILYTSHRGGRPWIGETHAATALQPPTYDPTCALCPGNPRLHGTNPAYSGVFVFENDLPCFSTALAPEPPPGDPLQSRRPAHGTAEVICYHPDHAKSFPDLTAEECARVATVWAERTASLAARPEVRHVLIFENRGSLVGTSNPHPHGQIYAGNLIYGHTAREVASSRAYRRNHGRNLGTDLLARELAGPRVIAENPSFVAFVPWFARYAYEVYVWPRRPVTALPELSPAELRDLGLMVRAVAATYDRLWNRPMPYVMAIHQAPCDDEDHADYPFHLEFHPPLRTPDTLKYLAGPEIGGGSMTNESNPDQKAAELRAAVPAA